MGELKIDIETNLDDVKKSLDSVAESTERNSEVIEAENAAYELLSKSIIEVADETEKLIEEQKKAAKNGDFERAKQLEEQIKKYKKALYDLRQEQRLTNIQYAQQATVAKQVSGNIKNLGTQVMNLQKNLREGTLDVSAFAETFVTLTRSIKMGLGPIGWLMLAVEGITMAWNAYAKSQAEARKETEEARKQIEDSSKSIKESYDKARTAVKEYNDEQERTKQTASALQYYKDLNATLAEHTRLINEDTAAQLRRLAITTQGEEHKDAMERLDLQNQLSAGLIKQEEYDRRLLALDEKKANRAKETAAEQKRIAAAAADTAAKEAEAAAEAAKYRGKTSLAGLEQSAAEVKARENRIQELLKALAGFKESSVTRAEDRVKTLTEYLQIVGDDPKMKKQADKARNELRQRQAYLSQRTDIVNELDRLRAQQPEYASLYGADAYAKEQSARQERQKAEVQEMNRLDEEANTRRVAASKASIEAAQAEEDAETARRQNAETREQREKAVTIREQEAAANEERSQKNEKLRAKVEQMAEKDIMQAQEYVRRSLSRTEEQIKNEPNLNERKRLDQKRQVLQEEEKNLLAKQEQLIKQADSTFGTESGQLAPGRRSAVSADTMKKLEDAYQKALATPTATDDELLLRLINLTKPALEAAARNQHEMSRLRSMVADLERKTKNLNR